MAYPVEHDEAHDVGPGLLVDPHGGEQGIPASARVGRGKTQGPENLPVQVHARVVAGA